MKPTYLFPHQLRLVGWLLAVPGFILGVLNQRNLFEIPGFGFIFRDKATLFSSRFENFTNELALALIVVGLIFIAFSRQKCEDELTAKMRLNALYWSILINYIWYTFFAFSISLTPFVKIKPVQSLFDYLGDGLSFWEINLFTPLLIFTLRFYYLVYKSRERYDVKPIKLLSNKFYRSVGKLATVLLAVITIVCYFFINEDRGVTLFAMLPLTMLLWVFSKEKQEDEYVSELRLHAMQWAIYANYIILLICNLFFYGPDFLYVMIFNAVTIPSIFLIVFNRRLYRFRRADNKSGGLNLNVL